MLTFPAHRTLITRKLKGLEDFISFSSVHWHMGEHGMHSPAICISISTNPVAQDGDSQPLRRNFLGRALSQIPCTQNSPICARSTSLTIPTMLADLLFQPFLTKRPRRSLAMKYVNQAPVTTNRILTNPQSSEIIRMLYYEFDDLLPEPYKSLDLYPAALRKQIDETNDWIYNDINNGVYKSGFATTQEAYEKAVTTLFNSLDKVEAHLSKQAAVSPFFLGNTVTESDIRLFTTIIRFDPVYVQHFKCNIRDIRSGYPAIHRWLRAMYWDHPAFGETTQFEHIKFHYTKSHKQINQFAITPVGPVPDILPKEQEVNAAKAA